MAARKDHGDADTFKSAGANIIIKPLENEVADSFLEYAYSVIHARALPDARDGLKPVHRRILFGMSEMGLRPEHAHVKSARVVGDVMGRYHPHGDSAIYEALVRMAQGFSLNTPLVDGHGNFGSPNGDGAAAMRYTECRMAAPAMLLVGELDEGTVDFSPNYDGSMSEPSVLPAAFPNLLVNGGTGIAVGMSTNMIPHNLGEVVAAVRMLIRKPGASLDDLMALVPGPDLPTGGMLLGLDQVRLAYETGKGAVRMRGRAEIVPIEGSRGRMSIVVTEFPYGVGAEKIIEKVKEEVGKKRLQGVSDVKDLSDRRSGTRLVIECKTGVNPQALLAELYRLTPLETSFSIANLALVDGQPKTLGLRDLLDVFLVHRFEVVTRRTRFRLEKAEARKHIVDGLLIALDAVDAVVRTIRASKDTAVARAALMKQFKLSEIQTSHILEMPLRRLVALEVDMLRKERAELVTAITGFETILGDEKELHKVVDRELADVAAKYATPRRTTLIDGDLKEVLAATAAAAPIEINDDPCSVLLSSSGLLARTAAATEESEEGRRKRGRARHDTVLSIVSATARGQVLLVTSLGRAFKVDVLSFPALPAANGTVSLRGGVPAREIVPLTAGETVVGLAPLGPLADGSPGLALGTRQGVVKVSSADWPTRSDEFDVIALKPGDVVVGAAWLTDGSESLAFVSSDAQLLTFPVKSVRPQGRSGGGMAGINLSAGAHVVAFAVVPSGDSAGDPVVVTFTGTSVKVTPFSVYPAKGRATGGVRAHKFLKGEDHLDLAWVGMHVAAASDKGDPVDLPTVDVRRDGSGSALSGVALFGRLVERG